MITMFAIYLMIVTCLYTWIKIAFMELAFATEWTFEERLCTVGLAIVFPLGVLVLTLLVMLNVAFFTAGMIDWIKGDRIPAIKKWWQECRDDKVGW